jgi:hypothetical protein
MEIILVADKCYPYIAKCKCMSCGRQFLAEYTDDGVRYFGNVCECNKDYYPPVEGYPTYSEWNEIRKKTKMGELQNAKNEMC